MSGRPCGTRRQGRRRPVRAAADRRGTCGPRWGVSLFVDDEGGYTTVAVAAALLVSLALVFGTAAAEWGLARSADVQEVADAAALAGANVVAAYATVVQVVDACVLSMGLLGVVVCAAGLVVAAIPGIQAASSAILEAGGQILDARQSFARSAAQGLSRLESAIPALVMANSASCVSANSGGAVTYVGVAVPFPQATQSDFSFLDDGVSGEDMDESAERLAEASARKEAADERAKEARERAWRADNVDDPLCMRSRASTLAGLSEAQNPTYPSPDAWQFEYARVRALNYYSMRWAAEPCSGSTPDELQRSCARKVFFDYALGQVAAATCDEASEPPVMDLPDLPHNRDMVRETELYTQPVWPVTSEGGGPVLHCSLDCPGATGASAGTASLADVDSGAVGQCPVCRMDATAMGNVANASTNIENGFEHYWREYVEAARDWQAAREESLAAERDMAQIAEEGRDDFDEAMDQLSVDRPSLRPAGSYGCVALVMRKGETAIPSQLTGAFLAAGSLPPGAAISAATLAPDPATDSNNVLASVFDGLRAGGSSPSVEMLGSITGLWGRLLMDYGAGFGHLSQIADDFLGGVSFLFGERVASWLRGKIADAIAAAGFEPADMRLRKPVLVNSQSVLDAAGYSKAQEVRQLVQTLPDDPAQVYSWAWGQVASHLGDGGKVTIAEVPIPGVPGASVPLTIDLRRLAGAA